MAISIIVEPSRSLNQKVKLILDRTDGEFLAAGAMAGAVEIRDRAKEMVPIDTGDLQSTIRVVPGRQSEGKSEALVTAGGHSISGNDVVYAGFVEFGTSRMQAKPFLRPAIDMYKEHALVATGDAVIRNIYNPNENTRVIDISLPRQSGSRQ